MNFEYKNLLELKRLTLKELELYYMELRRYKYENNEPIKGIELRKKINKAMQLLLKINRLVSGQKLNIIGDKRIETNKPKIFAVTHVGRYDIEMSAEIAKEATYLLMGDPGDVYKSIDGLILYLKGIIFVETNNKIDRMIAKENSIQILKQGGNILIFPEGAWNITENEIVTQLFEGTVDMARKTGAEIIPIAIEQYGKSYYANVGKNIIIDSNDIRTNRELSDNLRDDMATLKWDIWQQFPVTMRSDLKENAAQEFLNSIMAETENGYTVEEIKRTRYNDPNKVSDSEVFAFMDKLIPSKENAFLLKKRK